MSSVVKLKVKHYPGESPGSWVQSKLKLHLRMEKHAIERIHKAIIDALAKEEE